MRVQWDTIGILRAGMSSLNRCLAQLSPDQEELIIDLDIFGKCLFKKKKEKTAI